MKNIFLIIIILSLTELSSAQDKRSNDGWYNIIFSDSTLMKSYPYYDRLPSNDDREYIDKFYGRDTTPIESDFIGDRFPDTNPVFYGIANKNDSLSYKDYLGRYASDILIDKVILVIGIDWTGKIWEIKYHSKSDLSNKKKLIDFCKGLRALPAKMSNYPVPVIVSLPIK